MSEVTQLKQQITEVEQLSAALRTEKAEWEGKAEGLATEAAQLQQQIMKHVVAVELGGSPTTALAELRSDRQAVLERKTAIQDSILPTVNARIGVAVTELARLEQELRRAEIEQYVSDEKVLEAALNVKIDEARKLAGQIRELVAKKEETFEALNNANLNGPVRVSLWSEGIGFRNGGLPFGLVQL